MTPWRKTAKITAKRLYEYDSETDCYVCPKGQELHYQTTDRQGFRHYVSCQDICKKCELLSQCTANKKCIKKIMRHVWEGSKEQATENRLSPRGKILFKRRKETVERSFADAKELHGHRYTLMRGLSKM